MKKPSRWNQLRVVCITIKISFANTGRIHYTSDIYQDTVWIDLLSLKQKNLFCRIFLIISDFFTSKIFLATIPLPVTVAWSPPLVPLLLENVSDCVNSTYFHLLESRLLSSTLIGGLLITTDTLVQRHHVFIALWKRRLGIPTVFLSTPSLDVSLRWMSCTGLYNVHHHQSHTY